MITNKRKRGQSILELIVALLLVSIALTAVVGLITKGISNTTFNRNKTLANSYSSEALEWLRSERDSNWRNFLAKSSAPGSKWCLPDLSWNNTGTCSATNFVSNTQFTREINLVRVNASTINATVTVSWTDSQGTHNSQSTTEFTNWKGNL